MPDNYLSLEHRRTVVDFEFTIRIVLDLDILILDDNKLLSSRVENLLIQWALRTILAASGSSTKSELVAIQTGYKEAEALLVYITFQR